ncbi:uncharacterized protein LOC133306018 [Gastrolobium bilobum]|uniref:uncharacterized protein LOC133306018 n=1 Tax=Gastrolobium bilobum TaxID=150636 RepID=UPI002AB25A52|nr:uncharacterized protein LOC133306018 [Gastrolobium bilobum]
MHFHCMVTTSVEANAKTEAEADVALANAQNNKERLKLKELFEQAYERCRTAPMEELYRVDDKQFLFYYSKWGIYNKKIRKEREKRKRTINLGPCMILISCCTSWWMLSTMHCEQNVERAILHHLNAKTRFPKTYTHYLSQLKWLKNQYNKMSTIMRNNSGFGWDTITKTFTTSDESHLIHSKLREKSAIDYEELKIVFSGATATGNGSIALGTNDTDATTFGEKK